MSVHAARRVHAPNVILKTQAPFSPGAVHQDISPDASGGSSSLARYPLDNPGTSDNHCDPWMSVSSAEGLHAIPVTINHSKLRTPSSCTKTFLYTCAGHETQRRNPTGTGLLFNLRSLRVISKSERPIKANQHFISSLKCSHHRAQHSVNAQQSVEEENAPAAVDYWWKS